MSQVLPRVPHLDIFRPLHRGKKYDTMQDEASLLRYYVRRLRYERKDRLMQQTPPVRRGSSPRRNSQRSDAPIHQKKKSRKGVISALIVFVALVVLLVVVCPTEPISRAVYSAGTEDGLVADGLVTTGSNYEGLIISELMPSNQTAVPDENGSYSDWVEIWNSSDRVINLKDVGLSDRSDSIRFLFPDTDLQPDERVIVFCSDTNAAEVGKTYHAKFKLSSVGETVYLFDPNGYQIDSVTFPIMGGDESWALIDGSFTQTTQYSPGYENSEAGYLSYINDTMVVSGALIINEVMADPITGLRDEDGELVDWIELYNTTDQTISLDNYALSNKANKPLKWRFPAGATVAPGGYYVVFCSGKDRNDDNTAVPHTNFRISAESDTIILSDNHGNLVDRVIIDNLAEDCSYARNEDGSFSVHQMATPGLPNNDYGAAQMDYQLRAMNPVGVYITEVMSSNSETLVYQNDGYTDWVEIYNSTQSVVDLSGYGLSDNLGRGRKWQFPDGTYISPGEYLVVLCDGQSELSTTSELHTSFKISKTEGEIICLATPEGRVIDKLILPVIPTDVSYGRTIGMSGFFYYDVPTPMAANGTGFSGYAETPSFSVEPGLYQDLVITGFVIPEGTQVYYTTDGSIPTTSSTPYNGEALEFNRTTVLRARAFTDSGLRPSEILTGTFFVNAYHTLPVVSLVCDPDVLWNEETGMLVDGPDIDKSGGIPFKNAIYRNYGKIGQEGHIEYYLLDGTQVLDQGVEFSLMGANSLDLPQKSFKIKAKSKYGSKTFAAALFDDRPYTEYKSFVLRNSGNDGVWTRLLDGLQSRMLDAYGSQVIHQAWNPVIVYVNGVYWGHMNMRERVDRYFVAQFEGLSLDEADDMVIVEGSGSYKYGDNSAYLAMIAKLKKSDPANNPEDLQYMLDNIDIDNYIEYTAFEMFVGNSDPGNIRAYRLNAEGSKWKWIAYDMDYGLYNSNFNSPYSYTKSSGMGDKYIDNTILLKLLEVPELRDKFFTKLGDIFQFFTTECMLSILEPMVEQIQPEMNMHFERWAELHDQNAISEWPTSPDAAYRYWEQRVERLRNTIRCRPTKLWAMIQEQFELTDEQMISYFGPQPEYPPEAIP